MAEPGAALTTTEPKNFLLKPLKLEFKELFKALSKAVGHGTTGKWAELGNDAVEALCAIGLVTEPGELAFLLVQRSLTRALFELVGESVTQLGTDPGPECDAILDQMKDAVTLTEVAFDREFLERPGESPFVADAQAVLRCWLEGLHASKSKATSIADRLPIYFVYALNQEWRKNAKAYRPLVDAMDTPFTKAGEREAAWSEYSAYLQRRIRESVFDEAFGLDQIYIPLNAFYVEERSASSAAEELTRPDRQRGRVAVSVHAELREWLAHEKPRSAIRVISGGPGSGKSSFARIFAAEISKLGHAKVLFIPLHLIDPAKELVEEVGRFVRDE